jgi:hypothetical protein
MEQNKIHKGGGYGEEGRGLIKLYNNIQGRN